MEVKSEMSIKLSNYIKVYSLEKYSYYSLQSKCCSVLNKCNKENERYHYGFGLRTCISQLNKIKIRKVKIILVKKSKGTSKKCNKEESQRTN